MDDLKKDIQTWIDYEEKISLISLCYLLELSFDFLHLNLAP